MWACTRPARASLGPSQPANPGEGVHCRLSGASTWLIPVGVRGQAVAGGKRQPRRGRVTGQQRRRDAEPAQRGTEPQRG